MFRGYRFDLHPTPAQAEVIGQWIGVSRLVYNLAFEQRRDFWRQHRDQTGKAISWITQSAEVTALRAEVSWIALVPRTCLEYAIRDLDRAFANYFAGRAEYPTPRRLGVHDTVRLQARETRVRRLNRRWSEIRLPSLGWVRFRDTRPVRGRNVYVTVSRTSGRWRVVFACDLGEAPTSVSDLPSVGVDRGVANTLSLSNGQHISLPDGTGLERRKRKAQRALARRTRGSRRYAKQMMKVRRLASKAARARSHNLHVASAGIAKRYGVVGLEQLSIGRMTARAHDVGVRSKSALNRAILAQGWGMFAQMLEYKLEAVGGRLVYVPAAYTSQTCSACGVVDRESRKSQARFACVHCGHEAHADTNAALEIRRRSTALLSVEGGLRSPFEAETLPA